MKQSKIDGRLSISQIQAIIKLLEKKNREKRFVKNWRPVSLLNVDTKILFKSLAEKMKDAFPELTYSNQTAYVKIEKPNFRGKDMRTLINKAGYGSWRMGNSFM